MKDIEVRVAGTYKAVKSWDWDKSVAIVKDLFGTQEKVSKELIEELVTAKKNIGSKVGNTHGKYTFKQYCLDAFGDYPTRKTIDNWINNHLGVKFTAVSSVSGSSSCSTPKPIDLDSIFIVRKKKNGDGTYTVWFSFNEYPDTILFETFSAIKKTGTIGENTVFIDLAA